MIQDSARLADPASGSGVPEILLTQRCMGSTARHARVDVAQKEAVGE